MGLVGQGQHIVDIETLFAEDSVEYPSWWYRWNKGWKAAVSLAIDNVCMFVA
jgi:hypothetical protein